MREEKYSVQLWAHGKWEETYELTFNEIVTVIDRQIVRNYGPAQANKNWLVIDTPDLLYQINSCSIGTNVQMSAQQTRIISSALEASLKRRQEQLREWCFQFRSAGLGACICDGCGTVLEKEPY